MQEEHSKLTNEIHQLKSELESQTKRRNALEQENASLLERVSQFDQQRVSLWLKFYSCFFFKPETHFCVDLWISEIKRKNVTPPTPTKIFYEFMVDCIVNVYCYVGTCIGFPKQSGEGDERHDGAEE